MSVFSRLAVGALSALLFCSYAGATDGLQGRVDHFKGMPADTLDEALANLSAYNAELEQMLANPELDAMTLHSVHELTYTLENALERLILELQDLADTLEEVHVASEQADAETVRNKGNEYLETARSVVQ